MFDWSPLEVLTVSAVICLSIVFGLVFTWASNTARAQRDKVKNRIDVQLATLPGREDRRAIEIGVWIIASFPPLGIYALTEDPVLLVIAIAVSLFVPGLILNRLKRQRIRRIRQQLPDLLTLMAGSLRAGSSLQQTLARSAASVEAPLRHEIERVQHEQRLGASFSQAVSGLERRLPIEEIALLTVILRVGSDSGGASAEAIQSLSEVLRRKLAIEAKIRALTAQGRLQAIVMSLLPLILLVLLSWVDPPSAASLLATASGQIALAVTALLQVIGVWIIRRIVAIEV